MLPAGPLMKEHRVIERMIGLLEKELKNIKKKKAANTAFVKIAIDFIRTYADKCHHGKEEDILFRELKKKDISREHSRIMNELINEHVYGRETVGALAKNAAGYEKGKKEKLSGIEDGIGKLVAFYPKHIEKEDKHFFLPCMDYFSNDERERMLADFREFDRDMIHAKYKGVVEEWQKK
jgi:hemerythrin-like domain-containing protein